MTATICFVGHCSFDPVESQAQPPTAETRRTVTVISHISEAPVTAWSKTRVTKSISKTIRVAALTRQQQWYRWNALLVQPQEVSVVSNVVIRDSQVTKRQVRSRGSTKSLQENTPKRLSKCHGERRACA